MKSSWLPRVLRFVLLATVLVAAVIFGVHWLWNWLVPALFRGPTISLPQTLGLLLLLRLLGAGLGRLTRPAGQVRRRAWHQRIAGRMAGLSEAEREKFKQQMQQRCSAGWACPATAAAEASETSKAPATAQG